MSGTAAPGSAPRGLGAVLRTALPALCLDRQALPGTLALGLLGTALMADLPGGPVNLLRVAGLLIACGAAFALDDPSSAMADPVPRTRLVRTAARAGVAAVLAAGLWLAALGTVAAAHPLTTGQVAGVAAETGAMVAFALALSAALAHRGGMPEPGVAAAPVLMLSGPLLVLLPDRFALLVPPGPAWTAAHLRWLALLAVAAAALLAVSADPARPRR